MDAKRKLPYSIFAITMDGVGRYDTSAQAERSLTNPKAPWAIVITTGDDHKNLSLLKHRGMRP